MKNDFLPESYDINRFGKVYSPKKKRLLKNTLAKNGYYVVGIGKKLFYTHRLIANKFISNPLNKKCVNHKNGNKTDNRIENLEWCSYKENSRDAWKKGLYPRIQRYNEDNTACKFSKDIVLKVRELKDQEILRKTANKFNISISHVWALQNLTSRRYL